MRSVKVLLFVCLILGYSNASEAQRKKQPAQNVQTIGNVWGIEKANTWYAKQKWMSGANFIPSTAINQLEMWQADTYDSATIDRELGWAEGIGFNTMRVFLHSLVWKSDADAFKKRINNYLSIADRHNIKTIFVIFDDVWNKEPKTGKQPEPKPGTHNSGWMQDPGQKESYDTTGFPVLEKYVKDIISTFKNDERVVMWDLYNEPGNSGKSDSSLNLLKKVFSWARAVNPDQPLTVGLWKWDEEKLNEYQFLNSDIISYHDYEEPKMHQRVIDLLKASGRPLVCTEYMARTRDSRFANTMPLLKKENVGAINWGLVEGKTNTIYEWDKPIADGSHPDEWFHDVFFRDGKPYREDEVNLIKKLNGKNK